MNMQPSTPNSNNQIPGAVIYTGENAEKELYLEAFDYNDTSFEEVELKEISESFRFKESKTTTWINLNGLNHTDEIEKVGAHYDLHPLLLEDIVNTSQRPKIDEYDNCIFITLKMMYYDTSKNIMFEQVSFVLGEHYVLTFQEAEGDVFDGVRERIRARKGRIRIQGADYLLYALMDAIVDQYYAIIETMGTKIEEIEDDLFSDITQEEITQKIQNLKREMLKIRRSVFPIREIINRIEKNDQGLIKDKTNHFFRDVYDHVVQVTETLDIYREMIWSLMDMYMTTISNKMNEVMKVLTIIATIFIPLTFVAGIYGMNFVNIPELKYQYGYHTVWVVMVAMVLVMLGFFKKKKWL